MLSRDQKSCSRTQHSQSDGSEAQSSNPSIPNLTLYQLSHCPPLNGPQGMKTCLWAFVKNKGIDQPADPRSLISAFVIGLFKSVISRLAVSEISIFYLVFVAEKTCMSLVLSEIRLCLGEAQILY